MTRLFVQCLRGETTSRRPLWIMRQAGRYLPEYRALRSQHRFEALAGTPELAADVTLMPLRRFPLDAAIIFADLMSPIPALGLDIRFDPGPVLHAPVRSPAAIDALRDPDPGAIAPEVSAALRLVRAELDESVALLGFAGSPWSLAAYLVQGRGAPGFPALRAFAAADPGALHALLTRLTDLVVRYLGNQAAAGVDAVQLFDTWAGILARRDWEVLVRPHLTRLLAETRVLGIPRILFVQDAPHLVGAYAALDAEALAVDWREDLGDLRTTLGPDRVLQGNLDPAILLGGPGATAAAARRLLASLPPRGHVVNLGHGILPETPLDSVTALLDVVHEEAGVACEATR